MPEYVAALEEVSRSQEHISEALAGLANALVRSNENQEDRSRARFRAVYQILASMILIGLVFAVVFIARQQSQLDTLRVVVDNQQEQLDNQTHGIADRNRQFDQARSSDLCAQRLNAGFFSVIAAGSAAPEGSPARAAAQAEFARIGRLYDHIDLICYPPNGAEPDKTPLDAVIPP